MSDVDNVLARAKLRRANASQNMSPPGSDSQETYMPGYHNHDANTVGTPPVTLRRMRTKSRDALLP